MPVEAHAESSSHTFTGSLTATGPSQSGATIRRWRRLVGPILGHAAGACCRRRGVYCIQSADIRFGIPLSPTHPRPCCTIRCPCTGVGTSDSGPSSPHALPGRQRPLTCGPAASVLSVARLQLPRIIGQTDQLPEEGKGGVHALPVSLILAFADAFAVASCTTVCAWWWDTRGSPTCALSCPPRPILILHL